MIPRPFYLGLGLVLAVVVTGIAAQRLHDDPEHARPPHVERPTAGVTAPPPLAAVGGDSTAALEAQYVTFVEGITQHEQEVAEAERLRAAEPARSAGAATPRSAEAPAAAPAVVSDHGCAYADAIRAAWAGTGDEDYMIGVAMRESTCDPCAFYPGQSDCTAQPRTAKGLFQLLGHDDLLDAVCPGNPFAWSNAACNIAAARILYDGSGRRPWNF